MTLIRPSSSRFTRRSRYSLPELRVDTPRVSRRISLVHTRTASRSGFPAAT